MSLLYRSTWLDLRDHMTARARAAFLKEFAGRYPNAPADGHEHRLEAEGGEFEVCVRARVTEIDEGDLVGLDARLIETVGGEIWTTWLQVAQDTESTWVDVRVDRRSNDPYSIAECEAPGFVRALLDLDRGAPGPMVGAAPLRGVPRSGGASSCSPTCKWWRAAASRYRGSTSTTTPAARPVRCTSGSSAPTT